MLQDKDITKIQEIKTFFSTYWTQPEFFHSQLELFQFTKSLKKLQAIKTNGIAAWDIIKLLLILPFSGVNSIHSLYNSKFAPNTQGQKDVYYRLLSNQKINWRSLLFLFVKRYLELESKFNTPTEQITCLIFDDTEIIKTGKTIEGISKIHSHIKKTFVLGYKLLVAGYWKGSVFIPIDFSFHRESKKSKNKYGLTKKQQRNQKTTKRKKGSPALRRFRELDYKKNQVILQMYKKIKQRKIPVDYILIDSWFTTITLLKKLQCINKKTHIIGMYKYNSKVEIYDKQRSIKQLRKSKKGLKRSRKTGFYYMSYAGKIDGLTVKIFLSRKGKRGAWHTAISTDTSLSFNRMIEVYNIRWSIEVFFKEAKQLLRLGKSQSVNFDVQVAQTTITMMQYLLISLKYRTQAYETINGLFNEVKQEYIEHKLNERIMVVMIEIFTVLEMLGMSFDINITIRNLISYSDKFNFLMNYDKSTNNCILAS